MLQASVPLSVIFDIATGAKQPETTRQLQTHALSSAESWIGQ
jgi:hypothetical protein